MNIITFISLLLIIALGSKTSYSDIMSHKAYNKDILPFFIMGIAIQIATSILNPDVAIHAIINLIIASVVSFAFFAGKIWAAGDAKLFVTMILLIPYSIYNAGQYEIFPAFFPLGIVFCLGLVYVIVESTILAIRDIRKNEFAKNVLDIPKFNANTIAALFLGFLSADTADCLLLYWGKSYVSVNVYMLALFNILLITAILSLIETLKWRLVCVSALLLTRLVISVISGIVFSKMTISTIILVVLIMIIQAFTSRYNYRTIRTAEVEEGQILARTSLAYMIPSSVKGLPKFTDETTKCRLNADEVAAIKRWENSKYGQKVIVIVRHIPFAPFIFMGIIVFMVLTFYVGAT